MATKNTGKLRTSWLGKLLRDLREDNGIKLAEAAEYLGRSQSILSRMETGALPLPERDVEALLDLYDVTDRSWRESLLRLHGQQGVRTWWNFYSEDVAEPVLDLAWLESLASAINVYSSTILDGLLQTADYALAIADASVGEHPVPIDRWVELLAMRQAVLARAEAPAYSAVVDESLLLRPVGSPAVMAGQMRHLLALGQRHHVEIRVLPYAAGAHASPDGGFRVYRLPPPLTEAASAGCALGLLFVEPPRSSRLAAAHERLLKAALEPDESAELIASTADRWERP
jgi:transcriptional regulator with XRE-family HTH domain